MSSYPKKRILDTKERLLARLSVEDRGFTSKCFIWTGELDRDGYGKIKSGGRYTPTHWVLKGEPPEPGLELDHLCHVRACCRPSHLEWVTHTENLRRRNK